MKIPINWQNSNFVKKQRDLLGINKTIEKCKENRYNLEERKNKLSSNSSQQEIPGRIESLNKSIDQMNQAIERLIEKRNKIEIKVPKK